MPDSHSLTALVAARLAPLRIISAAWPLDDWLPCLQVTAHQDGGRRRKTAEDGGSWRVAVVCWHTSRAKAEQAASAIFRLLNGWDPPGPWHRVTARVDGSWQPAGYDRAWATVTAETRWEGLDAPVDE